MNSLLLFLIEIGMVGLWTLALLKGHPHAT